MLRKNTAALRVLLAIGLHVDKTGRAYPSLSRVGEITGIDRRHVGAALAFLETHGYLARTRQRRGSGYGPTNYTLIFDDEVVPGEATPDSASRGDTLDEGSAWGGDTLVPGEALEVVPGEAPEHPSITTQGTAHRENELALEPPTDGDPIEAACREWWNQFPKQRRANWTGVLAKYRTLIKAKAVTPDELLAKAMSYSMSDDVARGYACNPLRWLREERWRLDFTPERTTDEGTDTARRNGERQSRHDVLYAAFAAAANRRRDEI
jgi:hypothetical protein